MALGENCRTGCKEKNHESYAECLRNSGVQVNTGDAGRAESMTSKKWESELSAYRDARAQGIQPAGTSMKAVAESLEASDKIGKAYNADVMPATNKITKSTANTFKEAGVI